MDLLTIKPTGCTNFSNFILEMKLYIFRTVPLSIISSYSLYTQQWYMSYGFVDSFRAAAGGSGCLESCDRWQYWISGWEKLHMKINSSTKRILGCEVARTRNINIILLGVRRVQLKCCCCCCCPQFADLGSVCHRAYVPQRLKRYSSWLRGRRKVFGRRKNPCVH
jgi:hypothetical protein